MGGKCDNEEERPFPWVLGYKRRNDNKEVDITEFRVIKDHLIDFFLFFFGQLRWLTLDLKSRWRGMGV